MSLDNFETNLENEINASLKLAESEGRKVYILAVYSVPPVAGATAQGGLCRAVSEGTKVYDARAFIAGMEREIARLKRLIGER